MIVLGIVAVVLSVMRLAKTFFSLSENVSSRFQNLNKPAQEDKQNPKEPLFTLPINVAAKRYENTRVKVNERHDRIREKHREIWQHWDKKSLREKDINL